MSQVRVLVGTRKGAFVLSSDAKREQWNVSGPHFAGWEIYHLKGSPSDPNRLYASQSNSWFGQLIQRSDDGGQTWQPVGNKFEFAGVPGTHQWYDGTPQQLCRIDSTCAIAGGSHRAWSKPGFRSGRSLIVLHRLERRPAAGSP